MWMVFPLQAHGKGHVLWLIADLFLICILISV